VGGTSTLVGEPREGTMPNVANITQQQVTLEVNCTDWLYTQGYARGLLLARAHRGPTPSCISNASATAGSS